ncbi:MAG: 4'-phosphopantetheinyl transferase superfamily protein, partial [Burkholderiaceae bacterium]|nr:4'-phosphopantetheinyl transferase superfamily protein [Burkholderiaceae bacterium]
MSLAGSLEYGEAHVWHVGLDNPIWDMFTSVLSEDERERAARFAMPQLQQHFRRCRSALRLVLARYLNRPASSLVFRYGEFGKPELDGHRLQFNLSHSKDQGLIAISSHTIGIDLEFIKPPGSDLPGLIDMVCHEQEKAQLDRLPEADKLAAFYRLWSRKEAYCKMRGAGLQISLPGLHFEPGAAADLHTVVADDGSAGESHVYDLIPPPGTSASLCLPIATARLA